MENSIEKTVNDFINNSQNDEDDNKLTKNIVLEEREGLIERVDIQLVTKDGRQLLREQY